ncbi:Ketoisovalerate oxidoreductase subunit VorC [Candidatus Methanobinarius endosymbioticus]|uniref:Ketoisovalerate oxidoreductase subunit VorC n=1 Tax=Candidatus Methanobinarius endosymbioticus TaxID=2006182 RepID=A0A366M8A1_9EURY|nr:Ketoisovalerate oxidoreductase subunit VorC [Candidatus Methanobinarius endosymbioticus]
MRKSKERLQSFPIIHKNECKGCNRCVIACKTHSIKLSEDINDIGYNYACYNGESCNGCGDCYYTCPEPLAIEVHIPKKKRTFKGGN